MGLGVDGLGLRVQGFRNFEDGGFSGSRFRALGSGLRNLNLRGLWARILGFGFRV